MKSPAKREPLSRERILGAALRLVDREGLEAVSMRRVGEEFKVEAMSLYNHVPNKAAILDGIFEAVLAELPAARPAATWQKALRDRALGLRAVLRAHPNALPIFATRPAVTPASIAHVEATLEVLRGAGFSAGDALRTFQVLVAFVLGHTLATYATVNPQESSHPVYSALAVSEFPRVHEMASLLPEHDVEGEFEFGVDAIIGGVEKHARATPAQGRRSRRASSRRPAG